MSTQPEALRLAEELEMWTLGEPAAAELRRLHAENERLQQINQSHEMKLSVRGYELQINDLQAVNKELLVALKALLEAEAPDYIKSSIWDQARAAIAKGETK